MDLAGGVVCNMSFYYLAPGGRPPAVKNTGVVIKAGTGQNLESQTIDVAVVEGKEYAAWTKVEVNFVPETDGHYCFSLSLVTKLSQSGSVAFDDFSISGQSPGSAGTESLEPDPANDEVALKVPYNESFDNENNNYDGSTFVPAKWLTTGTMPFVTLNSTDLEARTGEYYLYSDYSPVERNECLYTPFFHLEAGQEYAIRCYVHLDGENFTDETNFTNSLCISVATRQDQTQKRELLMLDHYVNKKPWELQSVKFTPEASGAYCFVYNLYSDGPLSGFVAIEDFSITLSGVDPAPEANFGVNQLYDITSGEMLLYEGQTVEMIDLSKNAKTYQWSIVDNDKATISDDAIANPIINFPEEGKYTVKLVVGNLTGEDTVFKEINVVKAEYVAEEDYGITSTSPYDEPLMRGKVPTFNSTELDFISGPNCYYRTFAERVVIPQNETLKVSTLNLILSNLRYKPNNTGSTSQYDCKFEVVLYGETDGELDETKEFGRYSSTMSRTFGTMGIGQSYGEPRDVVFDQPIEVTGTFYIAFIYDDAFDLVEDDVNVGCSFTSLAVLKHESMVTTLYAKPSVLPENAELIANQWTAIDRLDVDVKGCGLWYVMWIKGKNSVDIAVDASGRVVFDVLVNDGNILVSGTEVGEQVAVYDIHGVEVASVVAQGQSVAIACTQMASGVYIVKTQHGIRKIIL